MNSMLDKKIKKSLYNAIKTLCLEKIYVFEEGLEELAEYCKEENGIDEETIRSEYSAILASYADAVSEEIAKGLNRSITLKLLLVGQNPSIAGFPNSITTEYFANGYFFASYYFVFYAYAITGKKITDADYTNYLKPLLMYETALINKSLSEILTSD